jgi:hypothetical protein
MRSEDFEHPSILSETPGRVRIALPGCRPADAGRVEADLRRLAGVRAVQINPLTGNALLRFDPRATSARALLAGAAAVARQLHRARQAADRAGPAAGAAGVTRGDLARAGLRGLLGHALVDTAFYAIAFAEPFGLPLAGLGVLHLGFDVVAWTVALAPLLGAAGLARAGAGRASGGPGRFRLRATPAGA